MAFFNRPPISPTVTGNDQEFVVLAELVRSHIGICCDNLLLWWQIRALLELKVANGSAERKVAIYSAKIDETTRSTYTSFLALVLRLVVKRQRLCTPFDAQN